MSPLNDVIELIRQEKYRENIWSHNESLYRRRPAWRIPYLADHEVSFRIAVQMLFRRSVFGTFLKCFNESQIQDKELNEMKLSILDWILKSASSKEIKYIASINSNVEDLYQLLVEAVKSCDVIDWDFLFEKVQALRMNNFYINTLDDFPRNFKNLRVLILCTNWLQDVLGANLPNKLLFLELFGNQIGSLENLVKQAPKTLLYLGLGRNNLTNDSKLHLLTNKQFTELRCLDLSDNDIYDLLAIVRPLSDLKNLSSLQLEGNPCSVCEAYADVILKYLPKLLFLDNAQVLQDDTEVIYQPETGIENAALVFTCHRIIGLPPPPKEKGLIQTIHVEVILPLLEEIIIEPEPEEIENAEDEVHNHKSKLNISKKKSKKEKKGKKGKKGKNSKKDASSPYAAKDEYADEVQRRVKDTSFKTARASWAKVIEFPEDAIIVQHPENDLKAIRDTFRSNVNVKVVYLLVQPPESKSIRKGRDKSKSKKSKKGQNKKSKDGKGSKKNSKSSKSSNTAISEPEEPKETILKKITLANFNCELHDINWSDKTIDFYWANHPKANPQAIAVEGSLRSLYYGTTKGTASSHVSTEGTRKKEPLPHIFTCHVGFGLKRL